TCSYKTEFHEEFIRCLKYAMIIYTREPAVENVIDFVTKFAAKSHGENIHAGRFRVCQLVNKLLGSLSENAQIDNDLCDRIHKAMLIRATDKYPNVRIQAALAMARLQDPSNSDCPTIKAYVLLLENDSNPERTRDVKEKVRKLAYQVKLSKKKKKPGLPVVKVKRIVYLKIKILSFTPLCCSILYEFLF
uniref:Uncharacterized protein n=1 Tax=Sinocyclocheilus rhinocerous TaxID=307959 RepID=A0A673JMZ7_9TELE